MTRVTASGGLQTLETIDKVIERCKFRIERALDVNVGDVLLLIAEIERTKSDKKIQRPVWHDLGTGD